MITKNTTIIKGAGVQASEYETVQEIKLSNSYLDILIDRGIKSYLPIFLSLSITMYGFFMLLDTILDNQTSIIITLLVASGIILYFENHRTNELGEYLSSKLEAQLYYTDEENEEMDSKYYNTVKKASGIIAFLITTIFIIFDLFGAFQMKDKLTIMLANGLTNQSEKVKNLKARAESGAIEEANYQKALDKYNLAKNRHYSECNKAWKLPKYRTHNSTCKNKFIQPLPTKSKISGVVSSSEFDPIYNANLKKVNSYMFVFFLAFFGFSLLLNYFAVAELVKQYNDNDSRLTPDIISLLLQEQMELERKNVEKLKNIVELRVSKQEEKNIIDVQVEEHFQNQGVISRRNELMKLSNANNNIEVYPTAKAGFINVVNTTSNKSDNSVVLTTSNLFTHKTDIELVNLLFDGVDFGEKLNKRNDVLSVIGATKDNANRLRDIYKILLDENMIKLGRYKAYYSMVRG